MRLREREDTLSAEVERELAALEDALAGRAVDPDLADLADLARELREERPRVPTDAAERLDRAAAEGFGGGRDRIAAAWDRFRAVPPRRWVPALGAAATFVAVAGVAISESGLLNGSGRQAGPARPVPVATGQPQTPALAGKAGGGSAQVQPLSGERALRPHDLVLPQPPIPPGPGGGIAPGHRRRVVERAADLTLSTGPDDVGDVADQVIQVTRRYRGFVLSSNVTSGKQGVAGAQFDLRIPSARLRPALRDLTSLAHVQSLSENGQDITGTAVTAHERFRDARAEVRSLLRQLANADTLAETDAIRARLRIARAQLTGARQELRGIGSRARLATVHVGIDGNGTSASGSWSLGDGLHDAVRVLAVAAGVALIALAALVPAAIVAAILWLAGSAVVRRRRDRALDA